MELYDRQPIYAVTHYLTGFLAFYYPIIGILALLYQFGQYAFNVRFFLFELKFKKGNSLAHTGLKLLEMLIGYILAIIFNTLIT